MDYCFTYRSRQMSYDQAIEKVTAALQTEGFGVLTRIDVKDTLKKKIDVDFRNYIILGACNPHFAHKALLAEPKLGAFLPCNVVVEQAGQDFVEISIVDPIAMMASVNNPQLSELAAEVREKLQRVIKAVAE